MTSLTTRRRFIEIVPFAGGALLAACSPKTETPPTPVTSTAPPVATPSPVPVPAPVPAAPPAPEPTAAAEPKVLVPLDEKDAQAVALGYVSKAARVDKIKFKNYVAGSQCSGCALFLGQAGDTTGGCQIFVGKAVSASGWCTSWVKKS